jgi:transposase-like protein
LIGITPKALVSERRWPMRGYKGLLDVASVVEEAVGAGLLEGCGDVDILAAGLDDLAREGARALIQAALEAEVAGFLGRLWYERSSGQGGYRNGRRKRALTCGAGSFEVSLPKIAGADRPFERRVIRAYERSSERIRETLPLLYAEGLSTRDFGRALRPFWRRAGLSRSSVSRANEALYEAFRVWRKRDLSGMKVVYLFLDGIAEGVRLRSSEKEGVLVVHGILEDGSRELLAIHLGPRETEASWKAALEDLISRGLAAPALAISDGCPGLIAAVKAVWPEVERQRCTVHKTRNVLNRVPRKEQAGVKRDLARIFHAASLEEAKQAVGDFLGKYGDEFPAASETLARDIEDCLTFYKFPQAHSQRIRTSNVVERAFREVRRRTRVVGRFPNERSALVLIWASMEHDRLSWRGVRMTQKHLDDIAAAWESLRQAPVRVDAARKYLAAA